MRINIALSVLLLGYILKRIKCDLLQTTVPENHLSDKARTVTKTYGVKPITAKHSSTARPPNYTM